MTVGEVVDNCGLLLHISGGPLKFAVDRINGRYTSADARYGLRRTAAPFPDPVHIQTGKRPFHT